MGMLNNLGKMPNTTINRWVDYICTNFFFEIVHKKGKMFGPDGLSRRKQYLGDLSPEEFTDGTDDRARDIVLRKNNPQEPDPLELDEFYEEIDSRKGFLQEILRDNGVLSLEWQFNNNSDHLNKISSMEVFTETMEDSSENSLETDKKEYDNNRRSEKAKRLEDRIVKQKEKKFLQKVQIPQYIYNSLTTGADKF